MVTPLCNRLSITGSALDGAHIGQEVPLVGEYPNCALISLCKMMGSVYVGKMFYTIADLLNIILQVVPNILEGHTLLSVIC